MLKVKDIVTQIEISNCQFFMFYAPDKRTAVIYANGLRKFGYIVSIQPFIVWEEDKVNALNNGQKLIVERCTPKNK
jgi:hypothetical protein